MSKITKKKLNKLIKMAENEIKEWTKFIKTCKEKGTSNGQAIQEERARIIPKLHKIRAGCPAKSFARQQAKELLKELMEVEK